jgi:hypothetical protein
MNRGIEILPAKISLQKKLLIRVVYIHKGRSIFLGSLAWEVQKLILVPVNLTWNILEFGLGRWPSNIAQSIEKLKKRVLKKILKTSFYFKLAVLAKFLNLLTEHHLNKNNYSGQKKYFQILTLTHSRKKHGNIKCKNDIIRSPNNIF